MEGRGTVLALFCCGRDVTMMSQLMADFPITNFLISYKNRDRLKCFVRFSAIFSLLTCFIWTLKRERESERVMITICILNPLTK